MSNVYGADNIKVLKGLSAVRKRPGMYIGDTGEKGLHHMIWEVVDNSIDEAMGGHCNKIDITVSKNGYVTVTDNGRGIPVDNHPTENIPAATVVLTVLHAGGKFDDESYGVSGGLHGVGVSVVNALSEHLILIIHRGGFSYRQEFSKGIPITELLETGPSGRLRGTTISFKPDEKIFETTKFNTKRISDRLTELAFLNPSVTINYTFEPEKTIPISYPNGIKDYLDNLTKGKSIIKTVYSAGSVDGLEVEVVFTYTNSYSENILSFVNSIKTPGGGTHEIGFRTALSRSIVKYMKSNPTASKSEKELNIIVDDAKEGLVAIVSTKVRDPQFVGQTKDKLGSTIVQSQVYGIISEFMNRYLIENPVDAKTIMKKVTLAAKGREAAKRAKELTRRKEVINTVGTLPGKLSDCQTTNIAESELYIPEGESASGSAKQARDRRYQAILPLKGKPLNVEKAAIEKAFANEEISNIITTLGTGIGEEFNIEKLRYGKVIIMADKDLDGGHIQTLLLTLFYRYMKPLILEGRVYIAEPPLYLYRKGKTKVYLADDFELNKFITLAGISNSPLLGQYDKDTLLSYYILAGNVAILKGTIDRVYGFGDIFMEMVLTIGADILINDNFDYKSKTVLDRVTDIITRKGYVIRKVDVTDSSWSFTLLTPKGIEEFTLDDDYLNNKDYVRPMVDTLFRVVSHPVYQVDNNPINTLEKMAEDTRKGAYIQRYKGLGEMNPEQLWETTMDPTTRKITQVTVDDIEKSDNMVSLLMGDEVEPRRNHIMENAKKATYLDI